MFDLAFSDICQQLEEHIPWLDNAYGIVRYITRDDKPEPFIYLGNGEYRSVLPDDRNGNFSFVELSPKANYHNWNAGRSPILKAEFSIIFWFNTNTIPNGSEGPKTEEIRAEISRVLWQEVTPKHASIRMAGINTEAINIFSRYYQPSMDAKYMMHPYGAIKFTGLIFFTDKG